MGLVRRRPTGAIGALSALALLTALSGCGKTIVGQDANGDAATQPLAATITPLPTATNGPQPLTLQPGCPATPTQVQPAYVTSDGLEVSVPRRSNDYPSELLPASVLNAPAAPYHLATAAVTNFAPNPVVNPLMPPGYFIQICNKSNVSRTLTGIKATIASFSARSGNLAVWHICGEGPFNPATKQSTPGCGGASMGPLLTATIDNVAVGASAEVAGGVWPQVIAPGQSASLFASVKGLASQGMYTLRFTITVDSGAPITLTPSDGAFLEAPNARVWTGTACLTAAMQAKLPAPAQDAWYVCPPAV